MKKLSDELRYEEAAIVRDRINAVRRISESQKVIAPELGDIDIIGTFRKEQLFVVKILFVRNGIMMGSRHFFLRDVSGESDAYVLGNFIGQFYTREIIPPSEILSPSLPEDHEILASWLSGRRGGRVRISVPVRGTRRKLVDMALENAEILAGSERVSGTKTVSEEIAELLGLSKCPEDIGAFDISNISGGSAVGAFVLWSEGKFRKDGYRHIKMDAIKGPDDYSMMREMVRRTFRKSETAAHPKEERSSVVPDLIMIDGGKGHLEAAAQVLDGLGIDKDVIGIAKGPDRVFLRNEEEPIDLEDGKAACLLLKRIRDEVHRFAITYHRKLRAKKTFESPLEKIRGIGKKRRFELLRHFDSIEAIRHATLEEISEIRGFNRKIAEKILESLKG
jgi:excinuclease ABC subunit C